ncbi:MAG: N-acetyltransferase [Rhodospirillaceae bacterium]|nr:MAG: N-acetyltransferase [Rhodospirillaceae bacterium]
MCVHSGGFMAQFPRLETPRCILESFGEIHLSDRYVGWLNDPETTRFSQQRYRRHDLESCRAYMTSFVGMPHYFAAIVAKDRSLGHIGNINAYVDERNGVADVGILVGERGAWGTGYGTEAWVAFCRHLLLSCGIRKVTAGTLANNIAMLGIMRKAGMKDDGRRLRQSIHEGQEVDIVYAALFRDDIER